MAANNYYSIDGICGEETLVPARLAYGCTGVGTIIDPSSDIPDLVPGTKVDIPLWMVSGMAQRNMVQVELPIFYGNKMRRKMKAGAGCEDLRVRCPHYYAVATALHSAMVATRTADEDFPAFILNTFRNRYKELLTKAPQVESSLEASQVQSKLSLEELKLFNTAAEAASEFSRWRCKRDGGKALGRANSMKRKWDADAENQPGNNAAAPAAAR